MPNKTEPTALDYIGVGGSIGTSLLGMVHSDIAASKQFERQKELMQLENDYAISQWHRENEYNLPINQVQRLKEAGLNPALMYDNGASGLVSGNVSNPTSGGNASKSDFHGAVLDPLTMAQIRNIDAQTEATEDANARENEKQPLTLESLSKDIEETKANIDNAIAMLNGIKADSDRKQTEAYIAEQTSNYVVQHARFDALKSQEEWKYFTNRLLLEMDVLRSTHDLNRSAEALNGAEKKQVDFMVEMARAMWDIDKKSYAANSHNDYVIKYYAAKCARISGQNADVSFWTNLVGGAVKDVGIGLGSALPAAKVFSTGHKVIGGFQAGLR